MTAIAPDADQLRQLDEVERDAWRAYTERLRELTGAEYERAEDECWDELQRELRRLDRRRRLLSGDPA